MLCLGWNLSKKRKYFRVAIHSFFSVNVILWGTSYKQRRAAVDKFFICLLLARPGPRPFDSIRRPRLTVDWPVLHSPAYQLKRNDMLHVWCHLQTEGFWISRISRYFWIFNIFVHEIWVIWWLTISQIRWMIKNNIIVLSIMLQSIYEHETCFHIGNNRKKWDNHSLINFFSLQDFVDHNGVTFSTRDIPHSSPQKFAITFVKRMKGEDYVPNHSFELLGETKKPKASEELMTQLKSKSQLEHRNRCWIFSTGNSLHN